MAMLERGKCGRHTGRSRRGSIAVEIIVFFPIFVGFLLGTIEFSSAFYHRQQLLTAAREGARVGAQGGTDADVIAAVQRIIGTGTVTPTPMGTTATGMTSTYTLNGIFTLTITVGTDAGREFVTVCVSTGTTNLVPNLIPYLVDLSGETLNACVTMNK